MLLIISGKSASGKDSIVRRLTKYGYKKIITYTTRPMRKKEVDGRDYFFISEKEFKDKINEGFFLEWKTYEVADGSIWYYGSPKNQILGTKNHQKRVIILTPDGIDKVYTAVRHTNFLYKILYIKSNSDALRQRLKMRGDKKDEVQRRMEADNKDFCGMDYIADKIFWNNLDTDINDLVDEIAEYANQFLNKE